MSLPESITSAILSDALDAEGIRGQVLDGLTPLHPGLRVVGRAATVQFAPTEVVPDDPYRQMIEFIDGLEAGALAVVATNRSRRSAFWGELFSAAAIGRGAVGLVSDGCLRDTPGIVRQGFPAFAPGARPIDFQGRMRVVAVGDPVTCGGVRISPGDLVLADDDGVVAVPHDVEAVVVGRAKDRASRESTVLDELREGATLNEVWERHRIL